MKKLYPINYEQTKFYLIIRARQLKENGIQGIGVDDLEYIYKRYIWKNRNYKHLNQFVRSIFETDDAMLVRWFSVDSTVQGQEKSLRDFILEFKECNSL